MAKKDIYSQFKGGSIKNLRKKKEEEERQLASERGSKDFLTLEDGKTTEIRIFPGHPDTPDDWYVMRKRHWLPYRNDDGDLGKRPIWNAVLHGNQEEDVIDCYIEFVKENGSADDFKKVVTYPEGIRGKTDWALYGAKVEKEVGDDKKTRRVLGEFGILEFTALVRDQITEQAVMEDDEEIECDPYTHPKDGLPVLIKRNKSAKKNADKYRVTISKRSLTIPAESLEDFLKKESLVKMFQNCYSMTDFEKSVESLELFDEENDIGLFENDEFQEKIEELRNLLAEEIGETDEDEDDSDEEDENEEIDEDDENDEDDEDEDDSDEEDENDEEGDEFDEFDDMTRKELLLYIRDNDLPIKKLKSKTDEEYREEIRAAIEETEPEDEDEDEDEDESGYDISSLKDKLKKKRAK